MPHNENSRVKIPALVHFTRLGYKYISLRKYEGVIDDDTNILVDVLCDAINRINATSLTTTDVQKIVNALKAMLENDDLGREFYSVLINGYNGLKLIDFEDFGGTVNSYHVVTEMTCKNGSDEFRPDITPLINGIPLAFIEVKKPNNKGGIKAEYDRMLMRVKNKKFRRFINLTQIMVFSNNSEYDDTEAVPLEGAFYSTISYEKLFFSHFREEDEKLLTSVPEKDEAVENFILTDNNLSSIKYSPEYVTNSSPVSPTNRIITSLFSFERILTFLKYAIAYTDRVIETHFTDDYFSLTLPNELNSAAAISPAWYGYVAAQIVLNTPMLFSNTPVSKYFILGSSGTKNAIDKHHIFPKNYLTGIGFTSDRDRNQIANFTYLDYATNIEISDKAPQDYVSHYRQKLGEEGYRKTCKEHALPDNFENMDYMEFLSQRRILMAQTVRKAYQRLCE